MTLERHVDELLKRTGVGEALQREAEEQRAAAFETFRQRKARAVARFRAEQPKAHAQVQAADEKAAAASKALDAAIEELSKARQARDEVVGQFIGERDLVDAELRKHSDPRVDVVKALLQELRRTAPFVRNSQEELSRTVRHVLDLLDELERIRIAGELGDITDMGAALEDLRGRIPR